ncbi:hypothetical protein [Acetomicrobium sp.]
MPGHFHLDLIAKAVREGIIEAGGYACRISHHRYL